jgi:hypothetical protein
MSTAQINIPDRFLALSPAIIVSCILIQGNEKGEWIGRHQGRSGRTAELRCPPPVVPGTPEGGADGYTICAACTIPIPIVIMLKAIRAR